MNVPFELLVWLVELKAALHEQLDDAGRFGKDRRVRDLVCRGHADHGGIAAQKDVRGRRVELGAELLFELAACDQILNVELAADRIRLTRRQAEILVAGVAAHELFVNGQVRQVAAVANATGGEDSAAVSSAQ